MSKRRRANVDEYEIVREQAERERQAERWEGEPLKQFVRHFGWLEIIRHYVKRRKDNGIDKPTIRYLTFPGRQALDIGLLWKEGLLIRTDEGFPEVAICDSASAALVQANLGTFAAVSSLWFEDAIAGPKGAFYDLFPFDVINLDDTRPLITGSRDRLQAGRRIETIEWILRLQRGQSFLLFLTTRPDESPQAKEWQESILRENLADYDQFRDAYERRYNTLDIASCANNYVAFTQIALAKTVARLGRQRGYLCHERFVADYDRGNYRMICHSFEFEPIGRKPAKMYEPRFTDVPGVLGPDLSPAVVRQSSEEYVGFVTSLLGRDSLDISEALDADPELKGWLGQQALGLENWWSHN